MLTQSQNAIISQIQSEFEKMNSFSNGVNYLELFNSKLTDLNNWKKEMKILTENNLSIAYQKFDDILSDLREICVHHNFHLSYNKDNSCDKWYFLIVLSDYKVKGCDYRPNLRFEISTDFRFENNTYVIKNSNLLYKCNDVEYKDFDSFMQVIINKLLKLINHADKVN